ncbi:MAG: beta-N-acetylhexosaminidase [Salinivirgaceae bacterium]|jgi:hexosaminidase|nr:beta-N-acetylhexosaminidase [Salinivirgaceae bacterium]
MKIWNIRSVKNLIALGAVYTLFSSCAEKSNNSLLDISFIPQPVNITATHKAFSISSKTNIVCKSNDIQAIGKYLSKLLNPATGFSFTVVENNKKIAKGDILLQLNSAGFSLGNEGYEINITPRNLMLSAYKADGLIRGIQTLRQALPPQIENDSIENINWSIPTGTIRDYPKFEYRGAMLDVARHFFTVDEVKQYIDLLTYYKINTLHLHLSDDQGWRIEIKSWPELTKIGASSSVNNEKTGFYTQDDYTEIVNYAAERCISIIPEIDMPGHTNAALASYAVLNKNGIAADLYSGTEVGFSSLAIHKEITYQFIDDVIRELVAITPGPYIHIGGDESHATEHNDYIYFINNVLDIVTMYNKIAIGWDEIANANINANHIVQYWSNKANTQMGIKKGAKVIFSPAQYAYLDMKYDSTTALGLAWAGTIEVDKAYDWIPDTIIPNIKPYQILGIEAPLWSETLQTTNDIEFMAFPRLCGIAEIGWSQNADLNWEDYKVRLAKHKVRLEALGVNYYKSEKVEWVPAND